MEEKCNCKDEFRTTPCPIHDKDIPLNYKSKKSLITDVNMIPEQIVTWTGYGFVCPECKAQILHNFKFCAGCGRELVIQSKIVTNYIKTYLQQVRASTQKG